MGDDILLKVVDSWMSKFENFNIDIYSEFTKNNPAFPPQFREDYNHYIFKILNKQRSLIDWTNKVNYDLLVDGGGGIHFDHSHGGFKYLILNKIIEQLGCNSIYKFEKLTRNVLKRHRNLSYKKKLGVGIGIGDFYKDGTALARKVSSIGEYDFIWVRDNFSIEWLKRLKFRNRFIQATDLAFFTETWMPNITVEKKADSIGLVSLFKDSEDPLQQGFYAMQVDLIKQLKSMGFNVKVYLFQELTDTRLIPVFEGVAEVKLWQPNEDDINDYLLDLARNKLIISGRAHGSILGSCLGVPSITIETSSKLREVSKMFPQSGKLLPFNANAGSYIDMVTNILNNYSSVSQLLKSDVEANRKVLSEAVQITESYIRSIEI